MVQVGGGWEEMEHVALRGARSEMGGVSKYWVGQRSSGLVHACRRRNGHCSHGP